jgi:hypothetical protein
MVQFSKRMFIVGAAIAVGLTTSVQAQEKFGLKGTTELSGSVSYSSLTPVSNGRTGDVFSIFTFAPQVGYFVTDGVELSFSTGISLLPGISVLSPERGDATTFVQMFFSPGYNFSVEGNVIPFVEAQAGYTSLSSGNNSQSGFSYGGRGGIKVVAADNLLLTFAGQYLAITLNPEGASERYGLNYFTLGVGVSGFF